MALTRQWQEAFDMARVGLAKSVPTAAADQARICDIVSSDMWVTHPWRYAKTTIGDDQIPLVDGDQDYSTPANLFRITKLSLVRTDVTPDYHQELTVRQELDVDLVKRSPYAIRAASHQSGEGQIRLESAVQIPTGTTWRIRGEFQRNPTKITVLTQDMWFDDHWFSVPVHGILYWLYKQGDDSRAETELALFRAGIELMWRAEDKGGIDGYFPSESLGGGGIDSEYNTIYG